MHAKMVKGKKAVSNPIESVTLDRFVIENFWTWTIFYVNALLFLP